MSQKLPDDIEVDYRKILEKISQEKEHRQQGLEELRRRKRELDRQELVNPGLSPQGASEKKRVSYSSGRRKVNEHVYEHLLSPRPKEVIISTANCHSRFEEEEMIKKMKNSQSQKNKLKLVDKKARYAALVKEIFSPTIDPAKKLEVEKRIERDNGGGRGEFGIRSGSVGRGLGKSDSQGVFYSNSQNILKKTENEWSHKL